MDKKIAQNTFILLDKAPQQNTPITSACFIAVSSSTCVSSNPDFLIIGTHTVLHPIKTNA